MKQFISRTEKIKDGDIIVEEGTWAYYAYVLTSGRAKVWKGVDGNRMLVGTLKEGDIFGEMSFFGMAKRSATVTADGDVKIGMITKDTFMDAVSKLSKEARGKLEKMTQDLYHLNDVYARLKGCLHEIQVIKKGMDDPALLEKEIVTMPEFLQKIIGLMEKRFHLSISGSAEIIPKLEEAIRSIDSLCTPFRKK